MLKGELVDIDSADKIHSGGNNSYTKKLIDAIPKVSKSINDKTITEANTTLVTIQNLTKTFNKLADECDITRIKAGLHYPSDGKFARYLVNKLYT